MATITLSLELELGWGLVHHGGLTALSSGRQRETETLSRLLSLCDDLAISVTFDVVGHLLLSAPLVDDDRPHPDGWFDSIPRTGPETDPEFYAPDLVEMIRSTDVDHEICTHTFSHVECGDVPRETLEWELDHVLAVHRECGLPAPTSFVPPRHSIPPYDLLRAYGFEVIRVPTYRAPDGPPPPTKRRRAFDIVTGSQPMQDPVLRDDLVESYVTERISLATPLLPSGQLPPHPAFRPIPISLRRRLHSRNLHRAVDLAIARESYVHLWSHLWDIANDYQWPQIADFLETLGRAQRTRELAVRRLSDVNQHVRAENDWLVER
ncbi:MAG: polysaccharide deacetylase [Halorhabdus sp.]